MIRCSASCYCLSMYRGRGSLVVVELLCVLVGGMGRVGWSWVGGALILNLIAQSQSYVTSIKLQELQIKSLPVAVYCFNNHPVYVLSTRIDRQVSS